MKYLSRSSVRVKKEHVSIMKRSFIDTGAKGPRTHTMGCKVAKAFS